MGDKPRNMKIKLILKEDDYEFLVSCLEQYIETINDSDSIRATAKLIDKIEEDYQEVTET